MSTGDVRTPIKSSSPNRVLAITVGALFIVAIIVAIFSAAKPEVVLDPKSPEGVVQAYLKAALEGNNQKAAQFFSAESVCDVQDLDRAYISDSARVDLVDSTIDGATAQVRIKVDIPTGGPFENFMTEDHTLRLALSGGQWLLTGIPWPLYDCGTAEK